MTPDLPIIEPFRGKYILIPSILHLFVPQIKRNGKMPRQSKKCFHMNSRASQQTHLLWRKCILITKKIAEMQISFSDLVMLLLLLDAVNQVDAARGPGLGVRRPGVVPVLLLARLRPVALILAGAGQVIPTVKSLVSFEIKPGLESRLIVQRLRLLTFFQAAPARDKTVT